MYLSKDITTWEDFENSIDYCYTELCALLREDFPQVSELTFELDGYTPCKLSVVSSKDIDEDELHDCMGAFFTTLGFFGQLLHVKHPVIKPQEVSE